MAARKARAPKADALRSTSTASARARRSSAPPHRYRPRDTEDSPRFSGPATFLRLPIFDDQSVVPEVDVLLCGLPFDGGASFRSGARFGPRAVRDASALARCFSSALGIDIYEELRVADGGDAGVNPHDVESTLDSIAARAEAVARSGVVGGYVGGDQSVTLGVLRGIHRAKLKPIGLLHIDSHPNTADAAWGQEVHHGSVIRHVVEEGLVKPEAVMQVGVRGPYTSSEDHAYSLRTGFEVADVDEVKWDLYSVVSQVRKLMARGNFYVTVDVSALDPAFAPGTSVPSPGGMNTWELQQILRSLVGADIVGFDVVEICPPHDVGDITAMVGVTVLQEVLSAMADTRRSARPAKSSRSRQLKGRFSP